MPTMNIGHHDNNVLKNDAHCESSNNWMGDQGLSHFCIFGNKRKIYRQIHEPFHFLRPFSLKGSTAWYAVGIQ